MLKVCLVTGAQLPIPDVKGGAIERILTMLIEDNEKYALLEFTIITLYDSIALNLQNNFRYTKFINIPAPNRILNSIHWRLLFLVEKLLGIKLGRFKLVNRKIERVLMDRYNEYDLVINECAEVQAIKKVAEIYGTKKLCRHMHAVPGIELFAHNVYNTTISVSEFVRRCYEKNISSTTSQNYVLLNCIDQERFIRALDKESIKKKKIELGFKEDDFIVLYCGRLIKEKGVKELIDAVIKTCDDHIKLLIIGASRFMKGNSGGYAEKIATLAANNNDLIKFTGYIPNDELYIYLRMASVAALPSICEDACPLTMMEDIISLLPQIATISGGMPEIGDENTTIFVNNDSNLSTSLSSALSYLYNNPQRLVVMREACNKKREQYYREHYYHNFVNIVKEIVN